MMECCPELITVVEKAASDLWYLVAFVVIDSFTLVALLVAVMRKR